MVITAEKERIRKKTTTSQSSDVERTKRLQKLKELKEKLAEMENQEKIPPKMEEINFKNDQEIETWEPPLEEEAEKIEDDTELNDIDTELSNLETQLAKEMENIEKLTEIDAQETKISKTIDKIAGVKPESIKDSDLDAELNKLQQEIDMEQKKAAVIVSLFDQLCEEHDWIKDPSLGFMYTMPNKKKNKQDFESWKDDWGKVLFDYARIASMHIVYSKQLLSDKPWSEFKDRSNVIQELSEDLVKQKLAVWFDKKKEKLRVYWNSLESWADEIVEWAKEMAITQPIFISDINEAEKKFSDLPNEDIIKIFNIIAKQGYGEKHNLKSGESAITINF
ncbi:MAG: hypothetical protein GY870_18105 [archaeon]|nr:hypothetical protein [archaeon]